MGARLYTLIYRAGGEEREGEGRVGRGGREREEREGEGEERGKAKVI